MNADHAANLALSAMLAAQANRLAGISTVTEPAVKASKAGKSGKTPKAPKSAKSEKSAKSVKPTTFPSRDPLSPVAFLSSLSMLVKDGESYRGKTVMETLECCYGFAAYLRDSKDSRYSSLDPAAAPGCLLESCRLICRVILDPSFLAAEDHSNRNGTAYVSGVAGINSAAEKMIGSAVSELCTARHASAEHSHKSVVLAAFAETLENEGDMEGARETREESLLEQGLAAIEDEREAAIMRDLDN